VVPASAGGDAAGALQQEAEHHIASHGQLQALGQQVRRMRWWWCLLLPCIQEAQKFGLM
jgi:hypothetical protein